MHAVKVPLCKHLNHDLVERFAIHGLVCECGLTNDYEAVFCGMIEISYLHDSSKGVYWLRKIRGDMLM